MATINRGFDEVAAPVDKDILDADVTLK